MCTNKRRFQASVFFSDDITHLNQSQCQSFPRGWSSESSAGGYEEACGRMQIPKGRHRTTSWTQSVENDLRLNGRELHRRGRETAEGTIRDFKLEGNGKREKQRLLEYIVLPVGTEFMLIGWFGFMDKRLRMIVIMILNCMHYSTLRQWKDFSTRSDVWMLRSAGEGSSNCLIRSETFVLF